MRIVYTQSVKARIDEAINTEENPIEYFLLSKDEYIQFLEELGHTGEMVICSQFKTYRKFNIKVV